MAMDTISREDARAQGLKQYFTGRPCKRGHVAKRWVHNSTCMECVNENAKRWSRDNKSRCAEKTRSWRAKNPEKDQASRIKSNRKWYAKPESKILAGQCAKRWRDANLERSKAREKEYRTRTKDRRRLNLKAWAENNPERIRTHKRNAEAKRKRALGTHSAAEIRQIFKSQRGRCAYCRSRLVKYEVDHIMPLARGGTNFSRNLQLACSACNNVKAARDPVEFAQSLGKLL